MVISMVRVGMPHTSLHVSISRLGTASESSSSRATALEAVYRKGLCSGVIPFEMIIALRYESSLKEVHL